ncbi:MAG: hypothetical protein Q9217_003660 [Psora testacea]
MPPQVAKGPKASGKKGNASAKPDISNNASRASGSDSSPIGSSSPFIRPSSNPSSSPSRARSPLHKSTPPELSAQPESSEIDLKTEPTSTTSSATELKTKPKSGRQTLWMTRKVIDKKATKGMLKKALELHDIEKWYTTDRPSEAVQCELLRIFELDDMDWPTDVYRAGVLFLKMENCLYKALSLYGYEDFVYYPKNGVPRLEIRPRPGRDPPKLPKWLQLPFLVPMKGESNIIIPHGLANPIIQHGDALYPYGNPLTQAGGEKWEGTLGVVMQSRLTHVALTAGHVIPGGDSIMAVYYPRNRSQILLTVASQSQRVHGRPRGRQNEDPGFQDDCGFLVISDTDISNFNSAIPGLDPHLFSEDDVDVADEDVTDVLATIRRDSLVKKQKTTGIVVYKQGASTGLTMGYLISFESEAPRGWYIKKEKEEDDEVVVEEEEEEEEEEKDDDEDEEEEEEEDEDEDEEDEEDEEDDDDKDELDGNKPGVPKQDPYEWMGLVRWGDVPFSAAGDSGSLVFAEVDNVTVPLGILVGAPTRYPNLSAFISLETFVLEAEKEGWDLRFVRR